MIKMTHKEIAKLIDRSEGYTRQLLARRKLRLKQCDIVPIIDLIATYRRQRSDEVI